MDLAAASLNLARDVVLGGRRAVDRAAAWPFIVIASYAQPERNADGLVRMRPQRLTRVVQCEAGQRPNPMDGVPDDAEDLRLEVFPASRFDVMPADVRDRYRTAYSAFLLWRRALALGVPVEQLRPGLHYSAFEVQNRINRWATDGFNDVDE